MLTTLLDFIFGYGPIADAVLSCQPAPNTDIFYQVCSGNGGNCSHVSSGDITKLNECLDLSCYTIILIHGWHESSISGCLPTLLAALLKCLTGDKCYNIILVDWSALAAANYPLAAGSTGTVAKTLAKDLHCLSSRGLKRDNCILIGFSLGAHIAGGTGYNMKSLAAGQPIGRVIGLDPAGPMYSGPVPVFRCMKPDDAATTVACHSDAGCLGIDQPVAMYDFRLNNGSRPQPGEPYIPCDLLKMDPNGKGSHYRSCDIFAQAICDKTCFVGQQCESYGSFGDGSCEKNPTVAMGLETPKNTTQRFKTYWYGNTTNNSMNLCMGTAGV